MVDSTLGIPVLRSRPKSLRPLAVIAFTLLVALSFWAVATLAKEFMGTVHLLRTADQEMPQWTVNQAEIEFLRYRNELTKAIAARDPDLQALRQSYDIFYSRFDTLATGGLTEDLRRLPEFASILDDVAAFLHDTVPIIDLPDPGLAARLDDLVAPSDAAYMTLRDLSLVTLDNWADETVQQRTDLAQVLIQLGTVLALSFLVLSAAVIALARLYRLGTRRQAELAAARDRALESERALRDSDARFTRAAQLAGLGHFTRTANDLDPTNCSDEYAAIFGLSVAEFMRRTRANGFLSLVHPEDREAYRTARLEACGSATSIRQGYRVLRPDGNVGHVLELERKMATDDAGQDICEGIVFDVTDLRVRDARLRLSEARLREAQKIARLGNWETDGGDHLTCSNEVLRIFGIAREEFDGTTRLLLRRCHPEDLQLASGIIRTIARTGTAQDFIHRIVLPDGDVRTIQVRARAAAAGQDGNARVVGTIQDITEQARAEEKLRQSQKMQAIGQLTGGVAHDFNNLLTVIMGNLELMIETGLDTDQRQLAEAGIAATRRGADLTRNMLSFARQAPLAPVRLEINRVLEETVEWARRVLPATIDIETDLAPVLPKVTADAASTHNAILNVILNARDAMARGGTLKLTTRIVRKPDGAAPDAGLPEDLDDGAYVCLGIADTGDGIETSALSKIFEPFFTTKSPGSGTGLGLSMVQGFMRQSGGGVTVRSEPERGTTFELFFPAVAGAPELDKPVVTNTGGDDKPARILLAEDELPVLEVLKRTLVSTGFNVTAARSGDEARRLFDESGPFDLVITDAIMPGEIQGPELAAYCRDRAPGLPVICISGYARQQDERARNCDAWLMKPVRRGHLIEVIGTLLNTRVAAEVEEVT